MKIKNYLLGYRDLYIMQDTNQFRFSLDSILLPNFITINKNIDRVLDIGCGNAPIPLILSTKTKAKIVGVEIQKEAYELALESININKLDHQIEIINSDIKDYMQEIESDTFDIITCNPPYFKTNETSHLNDSTYKKIARHEISLKLEDIISISRKLLKNNGVLGLVHRPERMLEILELMRKNNIEPKKIQFVYPTKDKEANILLIEGRKNGKSGLKILPPIYAHEENGDYTEQMKKYFENR